jgi:hypothetical protein
MFGRVFAILRKWRCLLAHFSSSRDSAIVACARSLRRAFFYNRIWDKLVTACEGAKIVGWGIVFATVAFILVMVTLTPILGGMLAIATGMVSNEITYSAVLLSWFKLRVTGKRRPKTISD